MINKEIIKALSDLDLSKYPYAEVQELIRSFDKIGSLIFTIHPGVYITRARPGIGYRSMEELRYVPQEKNKKCQRASTPNRTMFYGCLVKNTQRHEGTRMITISECSSLARGGILSSGIEKITFSKWIVKKKIELVAVIPFKSYLKVENNPLLDELREEFKKFIISLKDDGDIEIISDYFADQFTKEDIINDYDYFLSAVFTEVVTNDFNYGGVLYPSVRAGGQVGFNIALKPEIVDNNLKLEKIGEATYYKKQGKGICHVNKVWAFSEIDNKFTLIGETTLSQKTIFKKLSISSLNELKAHNSDDI